MYKIYKITSDHVVDYAAEELKKYLRMMMPRRGEIEIEYDPKAKDGFRLGLMQDFGLDVSDAPDAELDDILYIDTDLSGGIIAGDNPRSVLLAVYKYLTINGCRWLFPGIDGEYIPIKDIEAVKYRKLADMRYRGQCNEGAEFQPNMMEAIEFTPKIGMNVFMLEFFCPFDYYDYYYNHRYNQKNREPERVTRETVIQWKRQCEAEIAKRGLQFHDIGHAWATMPFGLDPDYDFDYKNGETNDSLEAARPYLALVDGKRDLNHGSPMYTNFCMSNPEARKKVVDAVCDYAEKASHVDYLHVWLGDSVNKCCECEDCQKKTHSDWYVVLLNEIDEELTKKELSTRIVHACCYDSLFAPETERLNDPERFSLLVAPITRSYTEPVTPDPVRLELPKYVRNKNVNPSDPAAPVAFAEDWRAKCGMPIIVYEYHFWVNQVYEPTGLRYAEIIHNDIKGYKAHSFGGTIEDGSQRSFFPNGFCFFTYASTLFDTSSEYDALLEDYYSHAYGEDWQEVVGFMRRLEECFDHKYLAGERSANEEIGKYYNPAMAEGFRRVPSIVKEFSELVEKNKNMPMRAQTVSYRLLRRYLEYIEGMAEILTLKCLGAGKEAKERYLEFLQRFGRYEIEIERCFDIVILGKAMEWRILKKDNEPVNLGI